MDDATRAELAALRLRAYGPDADIAADPAAIERLIELEARALQDQHVMVDSARALAPVPTSTPRRPERRTRSAIRRPTTTRRRTRRTTGHRPICGATRADPTRLAADDRGRHRRGDRGRDRRRDRRRRRRAARAAAPTPTSVMPPEAYGFLRDPTARTLYEIPLDRALAGQGRDPGGGDSRDAVQREGRVGRARSAPSTGGSCGSPGRPERFSRSTASSSPAAPRAKDGARRRRCDPRAPSSSTSTTRTSPTAQQPEGDDEGPAHRILVAGGHRDHRADRRTAGEPLTHRAAASAITMGRWSRPRTCSPSWSPRSC